MKISRPAGGVAAVFDLTRIGSLPNVSSCPKEHTERRSGDRVRTGQPTKILFNVLSAPRAGLCGGRLVVHEVAGPSTSGEIT